MSITCLTSQIGIKGLCNDPAETPRFYIQDLPGVSVKGADKAVNDEQVSGEQLIRREIELAAEEMLNDIPVFLGNGFKTSSLVERDTLGYYPEDIQKLNSEVGKLKGVYIKLYNYNYFRLQVENVSIMLQEDVTATIYIYDVASGNQLYSADVNALAGEVVSIPIRKSFTVENKVLSLFIGYDSGLASSYKSFIYPNGVNGYTGRYGLPGCTTCTGAIQPYRYPSLFQYTYFVPAEFDSSKSITYGNMQNSATTAGISVEYAINCGLEPLLCALNTQLAWPLLYKAGARILKQFEASRQWNSFIVLGKKERDELIEDFEKVYETSMSKIFSSISLNDTMCFACKETFSARTIQP